MIKSYRNQIRFSLLFVLGWVMMLAPSRLDAQYCLPSYTNPCTSGDYIEDFRFNTINQTLTGCANPGTNNYTDYTATINTTVVAGNTYNAFVKPGPTWGQYFVMFIDLNMDQDFDDVGEFFDIGYVDGGDSATVPVTIPCNAMQGVTRLRVMCRYFTPVLTQADVCATGLNFGEVEDYAVTIQRPPINATFLGFNSPVTACGMTASENVTVMVTNCGTDTITTGQVCYEMNGGGQVCETFNDTILPLDTLFYTFTGTVNLSTFGSYNFDGNVTVAGDTTIVDDSLANFNVDNIPVINSIPYAENFDSNNGGWQTEGTPSSSWEWGAPASVFIPNASSSPNAWVTNLTGLYQANETSYLISPCYDFSGLTTDPFILFSHIFNFDGGADEGWLEVSTDAGVTWNKLGAVGTGNNWYNDINTNNWDGNSTATFGEWRAADHVLAGTAGQGNVRVRFVISTDGFGDWEGMGVDNIEIRDTIWNIGAVAIDSPLTSCVLTANESVVVMIENFGTHPVTNFPVCFEADGGAPVCETVMDTVFPGGTLLYTFTATADMSAPGAHDVSAYTTFPLDSIFDNDSTSRDLTHQGLVNTFPYLEDFEGTNVWDADGAFNDWERGTPAKAVINTAFSGSNAWVTGGLTGQYSNEADNWVQSPCFDMTSVTNPWVASRVWWESEFSWDGVVLEYTTDGGLNWTEIGQFGDPNNWYTDTTINGLVTAGNSGHGWTGRTVSNNGSNGWVAAKHEIGALSGAGNVQFRMHFGSDFSVQDEGFAFDNFAIGTPPTVDLGPDSLVCDSMMINSGFTSGEFAWSTGDSTPTIWASSTGMYMLTYTDSLGLCAVDTIEVTVNPTPAVDMGGDQNICVGDSHCISIDVNTYPNLNWTGGATGGNYCINTAGGWTVMAMDSAGCPSVDSINTVMVPLPTPNLGPDTVLCQGDVLCLDPGCDSLQNTFIWSNGATSPVNCVNIISGYWVACIDSNGCEGRDSLFLTAGPAIPVSAAAFDTSNCPVVVFTESSTGTVSSYSWDFGDNNTSTSQNPTHSYAQAGNGTYNVTFIATNACGADTTNLTVDINCLVGIDDFFNSKLYVWPNPNNGAFRVETTLPGTVPVQLEIVNMQGQVVYRRDYEDAAGTFAEEVDLGEKASGVYFVRFMVDGHVKVEKIVVE